MYAHTQELPSFSAPTYRPRSGSALAVLTVVALLVVTLLCATAAWRATDAATTRPEIAPATSAVFASLDRRRSHAGRYHAEVVEVSTFASGEAQRWVVRLTRRDHRRVAGARVTAEAWMPETGERSPVRATASYLGGGRYMVDSVYLSRPGWWNLALVVEGGAGRDSVAFNVVVR